MEKIDSQLHDLPSREIPSGIHRSVMQKINYKKLQPVLLVAFTILICNFIIIVWHINAKLIDAEFVDMMQDFLEVFSFNFSFLHIAFTSFFEIVSPLLVTSAALSLAGIIYTGKEINSYHFS